MNFDQEITLNRDTLATIIPAGEEHTIPAGTVVAISQALGGAGGMIFGPMGAIAGGLAGLANNIFLVGESL